jgi:hypothetical protein
MLFLVPLIALLLIALPAQAQVYKCTSQEGGVVYSDSPCTSGNIQTLPGITGESSGAVTPNLARKPAVIQQLDTAVKSAIAMNDIGRAEALATTQEHWEWIAEVRKTTPQVAKAETSDPAQSADCQQAKSQLDYEAGKPFPDTDVLQTKRSLMYASCGIPEPLEIVTEAPAAGFFPYNGRPYGRHPHRFPHGDKPGWHPKPPSGHTSQPYDRHKERPFGSRFIRPEETPR